METRLRIEMFCNKVTKVLYSNHLDPVGLADDQEKPALTLLLSQELQTLHDILKPNLSCMSFLDIYDPHALDVANFEFSESIESLFRQHEPATKNNRYPFAAQANPLSSCSAETDPIITAAINNLYLHASALHLRLSVFFDSPLTSSYQENLLSLWTATTTFLEAAFALDTPAAGPIIPYATNYILQMIIAAAFTLLKLLNSFFAALIDLDYGKNLFTRTIGTIRTISVTNQDLPYRLAEVLAQLWRGGGAGSRTETSGVDSSLQLKVRCRMSMSLVYDSVWRWRENFQAKGRGNLECKSLAFGASVVVPSMPFHLIFTLFAFHLDSTLYMS